MLSWLTDRIDPRPLGLARIMVGTAAFIRVFVALPVLLKLTDPERLRVPYASWVPDPSLPLVLLIVTVWLLSSAGFAAGWRVRYTGPALSATIALTLALDQQLYGNHLYLMVWLVALMTLADAGAGLSLSSRTRDVVRWPVLLIMIQLSIVYGFSAITKLNTEFVTGRTLASVLHSGPIPFPGSLRTPEVLFPLAVVVICVELFISIFIWSPRLRPVAFVVGFFLHISILLLMPQTGELVVFALEMLALYPLFLGQKPICVSWDCECSGCSRFLDRLRKLDLLNLVDKTGPVSIGRFAIRAEGQGSSWTGYVAITRILDYLVPTLWVAPLLRVPILKHLGEMFVERRFRTSASTSTEWIR